MAITITTDEIGYVYRRYAYTWRVTIKVNGEEQDIRSDTVKLMIKTELGALDTTSLLTKSANVATGGEGGVAVFELSGTDTNIAPGKYYLEVDWIHGVKPVRIYGKDLIIRESVIIATV
jgi:hypothetical protein